MIQVYSEAYSSFHYWAIRQSWFARVNALCNLSQKKSQEVWVGVALRCV